MVVEVKNLDALRVPFVEAFLRRGFAAVDGAGYDNDLVVVALWKELRANDALGLLLDVEGADLRGFALLDAYTGPLRTFGWLSHFYAESPAARRRLVDATREWFVARGVYTVRAVNGSGASDSVFLRTFTRTGKIAAGRVFSVCEFHAIEEAAHGEQRII